jgi:hypothetical protein
MVGTLPPSLFELRRTSRFARPANLTGPTAAFCSREFAIGGPLFDVSAFVGQFFAKKLPTKRAGAADGQSGAFCSAAKLGKTWPC